MPYILHVLYIIDMNQGIPTYNRHDCAYPHKLNSDNFPLYGMYTNNGYTAMFNEQHTTSPKPQLQNF